MSNRGQRPRIKINEKHLPGGQYAAGYALHKSKVTVRSLRWRLILYCQGQLFCLMLSVCLWADQTGVEGQTGKLAYMDDHTHRAARA